MPFKFNPETGFRDTLNFVDDPNDARDDVQDLLDQIPAYINKYVNTGTDIGAANALVVTFDPAPAAYADGYELIVKVANANTGAVTININNLGAKAIKKNGNQDLQAGDLIVDQMLHLKYDGTYFQVVGGLLGAHLADIAYNIKNAGCRNNDSEDCGAILNGISGKSFLYFPAGTYKFTTQWTILDDHVTIILHPQAKIHAVGNITPIEIDGDYCIIQGGEIYSDGVSANNGFYGILWNGDYGYANGIYIHDMSYIAIMAQGSHNLFERIIARDMGWDLAGNYNGAYNNKWLNCKAYTCRRHGFSTDTGSSDIHFINCFTQDIGDVTDGTQGHDPYHFEGSNNGKLINCIAKWTANSGYVTAHADNLHLAFRIENSKNVIIDGFFLDIDVGFVPFNPSATWYYAYLNSIDLNDKLIIKNSKFVNNSIAFVAKIYCGANINLYASDNYWYGHFTAVQSSVSFFVREFTNNVIDGVDKAYTFFDFAYTMEYALINHNTFKNLTGTIKAQFMHCTISNNYIYNCTQGLYLFLYNAAPYNNKIIYNTFDTCDVGIKMSWWSTGKNENLVTKNLFKGVFTTILEGTSIGGDVIWQENIMHSTCTFTNASLNTAGGVALNADLTSSYDTLLVSKTGTAAPTTGTYTAGKKIFKANPTEAGTAGSKYVIFGWICIASGTPGTWVEMRALTGN